MRPYAIILLTLLFYCRNLSAQESSTDVNAQLYINRAEIQSSIEKDAINQFVKELKYFGIWDNIHALYIPTGGTEQSHKLNLKDPRDCDEAFRLYYPNGAEHSDSGTKWNGINQGALTFYSPTSTRLHLMVYQDEEADEPYMFSGDRNGVTDFNDYTWSAFFSNGVIGFANQGNWNDNTENQRTGFFYGQRISNDSTEGYVNGILQSKWYQPFSGSYNTDTSQKIWINKSSSDPTFTGTARYQVISIGNAMDSISVIKYYEIVQAFLTELGLQVGAPLDWPTLPNNFISDYKNDYRWVKATDNAVDTLVDGASLYGINDSLYIWGGWNGNWYPFDFNSGYVSGDGGRSWAKISSAPWDPRHTAAYGSDENGNAYLIGSDLMPESTDVDRKEVWKTIDGRNWTLQTNQAPWSEKLALHGLAIKGDTLFVGGGQFGTTVNDGLNDTIWQSADGGVNWTVINTNAPHLGGSLYNNFKYFPARGKFVAFCGAVYDNDPSLRRFSNEIWISDDCITWQKECDAPFAARQYSDMAIWDDKLWIWAGDRSAQTGNGTLNLKDLWYMDKDGGWHEMGSVPIPQRHATSFAVDKKNDRLVFACGNMFSDVWWLERVPLHEDKTVFLSPQCNFVVPDCIDSLSNNFGASVSITQIPAAGTIISSSPRTNIPAKIIADYGNGDTQTTIFYFMVKDTTAPLITSPADRIVYLEENCSFHVPNVMTSLVVSDCDTVTLNQSLAVDSVINAFDGAVFNINVTATDGSDNFSTSNVRIILKDTTAPVFIDVNRIVEFTDGRCEKNISITAPEAIDNCTNVSVTGMRSDSLQFTDPFPVGITTIKWQATDMNGNMRTCTQEVEVIDHEQPVLNFINSISFCVKADKNYSVPKLTATDNCGIDSIMYSISGTTQRRGVGNDASGIFNQGLSRITWTVTDIHGNTSTAETQVNIVVLSVTIPDVYVLPKGANANTLYIGYGPAKLELVAVANNGYPNYSYEWSNSDTTNLVNIENPPGTYSYHVAVRDALGCTAEASKEIKIVDVRCGGYLDKVSVCKLENDQLSSICVNSEDVSELLEHGAYLGICANNLVSILNSGNSAEIKNKLQIVVMPNPANQYFTIKIESFANEPISVKLINGIGVTLDEKTNLRAGIVLQMGQKYPSGIYFLEVRQGNERVINKLIKTNSRN